MGLEKQTREIDGRTFHVTPLGAIEGRKLLLRLAKAVGPSFADIEADLTEDGKDLDVFKLFGTLAATISENDLEHLCAVLGKVTEVEMGEGALFLDAKRQDTVFAGRMKLMFGWIAFALKVQYSDFFGDKLPT